jgi:hypothetical protein
MSDMQQLCKIKGSFSCELAHGSNETVAKVNYLADTSCPCLPEANSFIVALSSWRDRIVNLTEGPISKALRNYIPEAGVVGLALRFHVPHLVVVTKWLPLSPKQTPFTRKTRSWSKGIGVDRWSRLTENTNSVD